MTAATPGLTIRQDPFNTHDPGRGRQHTALPFDAVPIAKAYDRSGAADAAVVAWFNYISDEALGRMADGTWASGFQPAEFWQLVRAARLEKAEIGP